MGVSLYGKWISLGHSKTRANEKTGGVFVGDKMFSIVEAAAANELVGRYLIEGKGDLREPERRLLGRILLEAQFTLDQAQTCGQTPCCHGRPNVIKI